MSRCAFGRKHVGATRYFRKVDNCDCRLHVLWVEVDVCPFVCGKRDA